MITQVVWFWQCSQSQPLFQYCINNMPSFFRARTVSVGRHLARCFINCGFERAMRRPTVVREIVQGATQIQLWSQSTRTAPRNTVPILQA